MKPDIDVIEFYLEGKLIAFAYTGADLRLGALINIRLQDYVVFHIDYALDQPEQESRRFRRNAHLKVVKNANTR